MPLNVQFEPLYFPLCNTLFAGGHSNLFRSPPVSHMEGTLFRTPRTIILLLPHSSLSLREYFSDGAHTECKEATTHYSKFVRSSIFPRRSLNGVVVVQSGVVFSSPMFNRCRMLVPFYAPRAKKD